ncbi:MAG: 3-oxoacyl-ACP synthase [Flavobacteriaceae bacterium]|nr:3-oxoacyl-ACP synthase [Flavobacteriaceae bacterium]
MTTLELKFELQQQCKDLINFRLERIQKVIADIETSLKEESKSTSGDKHHTGRAMLQIERENAGNQLREIEKVLQQLDKVDISSFSRIIRLGSLAETNNANFFISISVGKLEVNNIFYLGVAPNAPIGLCLLGKTEGEQFNFNGMVYKIEKVS